MLWFTLPLLFVSGSLARLVGWGNCPTVIKMTDFAPSSFIGSWYEAYRSSSIFEAGGSCVTAKYTLNDNGTITVLNTAKLAEQGITVAIEGIATVVGDSANGLLSVKFSSSPTAAPYQVLGVKYGHWAVVCSCTKIGLINFQFTWILTRERNPSQSVLDEAFAVCEANSLSTTDLLPTDQSNCAIA
ncbi:apolipoprotein D-like [Diprion similis]|uniref:apolipoprotein D-like n=1 Tax=Diprion similis TaxID=362088 RepID=UPI001EF868C4|nr:apolipoprotein D-like [Diprion similis]